MADAPTDDRVLDAVAEVLARDGLKGLTISAIAEEAGVSRVTLHRRGAKLEDYVVAVVGRASDDLRASLWPVLTGPGDAASRLVAALEVLCEVYERHAGPLGALYCVSARPLPGRPGRTTSMEFIEPIERLLRDGELDGSLTTENPRDDALLVANMVAWSYLHMRKAHKWSASKASAQIVTMATAHLLAKP